MAQLIIQIAQLPELFPYPKRNRLEHTSIRFVFLRPTLIYVTRTLLSENHHLSGQGSRRTSESTLSQFLNLTPAMDPSIMKLLEEDEVLATHLRRIFSFHFISFVPIFVSFLLCFNLGNYSVFEEGMIEI